MEKRGWLDAVLGLGPDWRITRVERTTERKELRVELARAGGGRLRCPHCGEACPGYDTRRREWRNLDAWGYSTFLVCDVPRMRCREHGVVTMQVPWAEGSSRYTAEFEAEAIRWLKEASVQAVAQRMRLSWNAADGIMQRAVARGLARRPEQAVRHLSVDETAFRWRHQYVTVVSNPKKGIVLYVAQGRGKQAFNGRRPGGRHLDLRDDRTHGTSRAPGVLASRLVDPYVEDFGAITAFALNVVCIPDRDLKRRLFARPPGPSVGRMPRQFVTRTFDDRVISQPGQEARDFIQFVDHLMGLRRKVFLATIRAIRTYATSMQRLCENLDVAYSLLISSLEPLAQGFDGLPPSWDDYPEDKRIALDEALGQADGQTKQNVRDALLKIEHVAIARRVRSFVHDHLEPSFFREEAVGKTKPVGRAGLDHCLRHAYDLRSRYLHGSRELPRTLTLGVARHAETVWVDAQTILTFEGLSRVVRHAIKQFVLRQEMIDKEPCDYSDQEPGIVRQRVASKYWIDSPDGLRRSDGRKRLFAFCQQLADGLGQEGPARETDMSRVLTKACSWFPSITAAHRRAFLALYCLYNGLSSTMDRVDGDYILRTYGQDLDEPAIEAMFLALLTGNTPAWPLSVHRQVHDAYFAGKERDRGIKIPALLEVGLTLELAERFRHEGGGGEARELIAVAVENLPGAQRLSRFEDHFDTAEPIAWRSVMDVRVGEASGDLGDA